MTQNAAPVSANIAGMSIDRSRVETRANLEKAGQRFEAIFVNMMLKSMRSARLAESLFESSAMQQFRDMQDQQLARTMAETTPIGIGKAMTEFLAKSQENLAAESAAPSSGYDAPAPFAPSLSKGGPSSSVVEEKGRGFDRLSPNGSDGDRRR